MRRFVLVFLLALTAAFTFSDRIAGALLDPYLESSLRRLFGMTFKVNSLRADLFTGRVSARGVSFVNQPGYSYSPHLSVRELDFHVDFPALLRKKVLISRIEMNEPYYLIERRAFSEESSSNLRDWIRYMKARKKKKKQEHQDEEKPTEWEVRIDFISIRRGVFIYDDQRSSDSANRFVFRDLDGGMSGFVWPAGNPSDLKQTVHLRGLIGESFPAAAEVHGKANFPTGRVSFDLEGRIRGGQMFDYRRFWSDLPILIEEGRFDWRMRMICREKKVESQSELRLYGLKVVPAVKGADLLWGLPMTGALGFLQNEKEILLKVPVAGDITDPQFYFYKAFSKAFQDALGSRLQGGLKLLTQTPAALVEQTKTVVVKAPSVLVQTPSAIVQAPEKIAGGITSQIETIGTLVTPKKENSGEF